MTAMRLKNKIVLVTGSSGAIGAAVAKRLAGEGAHVIGADLQPSSGDSLLAEHHRLDVTDQASIDSLAHRVGRYQERVDAICLFAGVLTPGTVESMSDHVWQRHLDVNLTGYAAQIT
jgi:NAD(P)-dependent dehydrogenase (short-subunit alcohol dehydrogenase family)